MLLVSFYQCATILPLGVASIRLQMQNSTSVTCCQYQSKNSPQYFRILLPVSVYYCATVIRLFVASISPKCITDIQLSISRISVTMHQSTSVICSQDQFTNAPEYICILLPVSVYISSTVIEIFVASISLQIHLSNSVACCQYLSIYARQ